MDNTWRDCTRSGLLIISLNPLAVKHLLWVCVSHDKKGLTMFLRKYRVSRTVHRGVKRDAGEGRVT